jgi:hypothetical protein
MPPSDQKDVRDWLTSAERGDKSWRERGTELAAALHAATEPIEPTPLDEPTQERRADCPEIVLGTDQFRVNAEATAALAWEEDIYQRGGLLVHVLKQNANSDPTDLVRRSAGTPVVRDLAKPLLRERLTRCARWVQVKSGADGEYTVPTHPPGWAVDAIHVRGDWPNVRRLEAVVTHPVFLPDGTLLATNGYHAQSGILVALPSDLTITVPDSPTRDDVQAAVDTLLDPIADFPFETPAHRSALVAGLLTPLAWFAFPGPAPLFLIDKNIRGVGGGLLADVVAILLTGRRFPVMTYTSDKEELRKRITTAAVEGERLLLLDNLVGAVGNDILDAALTTDRWKDRLLGGNRMYDGPLHVNWWGTGNNVQLLADTSRRVCHIRMESTDERPELREGLKYRDLRAHVRANRGRLLSAALTILRGWFVAGKPTHQLKPWGSYEPWSDVVRETVVSAGLPDPGETRIALQTAADRDAGAMAGILDGLERMDPDRRGLTTAEIITRLTAPEATSETPEKSTLAEVAPESVKETTPTQAWKADMRSAIDDLCGKLDRRALGYKLRHFQRRNFGGRMIDKAGTDGSKTTRWVVIDVSGGTRPESSPGSPASPESRPSRSGDAGDPGDGSDRTQSASGSPTPPPIDPPSVWDDWERFYALMHSRGWTWPDVLRWLSLPPTTGFFEVPPDHRRRAAEYLTRLHETETGFGK